MATEESNNIIKTLHVIYNQLADENHVLTKANVAKIFFENSIIDICDYNIFIIYRFLERICPNTEEINSEHFMNLIFCIYNQQTKHQAGMTEPSIDEIVELTEMSEEAQHNLINSNVDLLNGTQNIIKVLKNQIVGKTYSDICYPDFYNHTIELILDSAYILYISNFHESMTELFDMYSTEVKERKIRIINMFDVIYICWKYNIANTLKSNSEVARILQYFFKPGSIDVKILEDIFDDPELKTNKERISEIFRDNDILLENINFTYSTFVMFLSACAIHYKDELETQDQFIQNFEDFFIRVIGLRYNRGPQDEIEMDNKAGNSFRETEPKESEYLGKARRMQEEPDNDDATFLQDCLNVFDKDLPIVPANIKETQNILPNHSNTLFVNKMKEEKFKFPINTLNVEIKAAADKKIKEKEDKEIIKARKPEKKEKKGPTVPIIWEEKPSAEKDKIRTFGHDVVQDLKQRFLKFSYKDVLVNNYVYPSLIREVLVIPKNISKEVRKLN